MGTCASGTIIFQAGAPAPLGELIASAPLSSCAFVLTPSLAITDKVLIQFDVKLPAVAFTDFRRLIQLGSDDDVAVTLGWRGDKLNFTTVASVESFALLPGWHRISIQRAMGKYVLFVDGVQLSSGTPMTALPTAPLVIFGVIDQVAGDINVSYDNLLVLNQL